MEDTRERMGPGPRVEVPLPGSPDAGASAAALRLPRFLCDASLGLEELGTAVIEWAAELFGFERGFLLRELHPGGEDDEASFEVLVSATGRDGPRRAVVNPELAVSRSLALRALAAAEPLAVDDCLIQGAGEDEAGDAGRHRAVLAASCILGPGVRGALYLDRGLGMEGVSEESRVRFGCLLESATSALSRAWLAEEVVRLREAVGEEEPEVERPAPVQGEEPPAYHGIIGRDEKLRKIFHVIEKVKDSELNICIFGESGTGKELVARAVHEAGRRRDSPFVSENCGAISENLLESELFGHVKGSFTGADEDKQGLFEAADGGTLFLDEIGDMSEGMQRKLLRALQEGLIRPIGSKRPVHVDVRVICASNRDLKHLVQEGSFRADLYYRLNVIQLEIPPLRERRGDIPLLMEHFTDEIARTDGTRKRFSESARNALLHYSWPGNVRELRNLLRRVLLTSPRRVVARKDVLPYLTSDDAAACLGENISRDDEHLLLRIPLRKRFGDIIEECERLVLLNALKENGWNKSRVTKALGIPRQSLYNKIAKYELRRSWPGDE